MRWSVSFPDLFNANRLGTRLKMGSKLEGEGTIHVVAVMFTLPEDVGSLIRALTVFQELDVHPNHIESRSTARNAGRELDYFVQCKGTEKQLERIVEELRTYTTCVTVYSDTGNSEANKMEDKLPWFPKSIHELHKCCTELFKYGSELTPDHPGYGDPVYSKRREYIATIANSYKYGAPIPGMEYTEDEIQTWGEVFRYQTRLFPTYACKEYNEHFPMLFEACGYREDNIPQLEDVSRYLRTHTGWQLWPVVGWISARNFLASLAFRIFPTTQYIRHKSSPFYTPEPDICHELIGHVPLFCDPSFAQFSQEIGLASLGVSDEWIKKLATVYWFTVEFGLVRENGTPKAYGAGLLSGSKELQYCVTDQPEHKDFDIATAMVQMYPETGLQPLYFVAESLEVMKNQMIDFAKMLPRPFALHYNPYTQNVEVLNSSLFERCERDTRHKMGGAQEQET